MNFSNPFLDHWPEKTIHATYKDPCDKIVILQYIHPIIVAGTQTKVEPKTGTKERCVAIELQRKAPWIFTIKKVIVRITPWKGLHSRWKS
jgi:hypothetical protein